MSISTKQLRPWGQRPYEQNVGDNTNQFFSWIQNSLNYLIGQVTSPTAATGFTATSIGNGTRLTWDEVEGASYYNIYESSLSTLPANILTTVPANQRGSNNGITLPLGPSSDYYAVQPVTGGGVAGTPTQMLSPSRGQVLLNRIVDLRGGLTIPANFWTANPPKTLRITAQEQYNAITAGSLISFNFGSNALGYTTVGVGSSQTVVTLSLQIQFETVSNSLVYGYWLENSSGGTGVASQGIISAFGPLDTTQPINISITPSASPLIVGQPCMIEVFN